MCEHLSSFICESPFVSELPSGLTANFGTPHFRRDLLRNSPPKFKALLTGGKVFSKNFTIFSHQILRISPKILNTLLQAWKPQDFGVLSIMSPRKAWENGSKSAQFSKSDPS